VIDDASFDEAAQDPPGQVDFGSELRYAREQSGLTLRAIADTTKLPVYTLKALEDNRIGQLPGGIYRRAIVRAYAAEVGLDPERAVRAFIAGHPDEVPSPAAPAAAARRGMPRGLAAVLSLAGTLIPVLAGVLYFASRTAGSDTPRQIIQAPPTRQSATVEARPAAFSAADSLAMMVSVSSQTRLAVIADGREVVARQVEPGEVIRFTVSDDVVLMGDNAGAVQFSINGRAGRPLGDDGVRLGARIPRAEYQSWLIQQ
jgi:transcriptional regulator with XRE-family HTH domain